MVRLVLTDAQRAKMEPHCLGKPSDLGRSESDNRRFVEVVLWIVRTSSPWRDLPTQFRKWNTAVRRYRDRSNPMSSSGCAFCGQGSLGARSTLLRPTQYKSCHLH